jgi:multisubunit Na+/H+ antiporter MnhE subunit
MRYVLSIAALTIVYCFTLASFYAWDIALGVVVSALLVSIFRTFLFPPEPAPPGSANPSFFTRVAMVIPFFLAIVWEITRSTWTVLLIVLGIRQLYQPGIVRVPVGNRTKTGVAVSGIATTLAPGTVFVDVDWEAGSMLIHAIDARDPDSVRKAHQDFYDRFQQYVFP